MTGDRIIQRLIEKGFLLLLSDRNEAEEVFDPVQSVGKSVLEK